MSSRESGRIDDHCRRTCHPPSVSPPVATSAAAPSAKIALETTKSPRWPYWKWRLQSSTATTTTTLRGSAAKAPATRRLLKAPWHPMKPMCVRATVGESPTSATIWRSTPGLAKPVQEQVTRCVTRPASMPERARAPRAAATASPPASLAYRSIRTAVVGPASSLPLAAGKKCCTAPAASGVSRSTDPRVRIRVCWYIASSDRWRPGGTFPNDTAKLAASPCVIRCGGVADAMARIVKLMQRLPVPRRRRPVARFERRRPARSAPRPPQP